MNIELSINITNKRLESIYDFIFNHKYWAFVERQHKYCEQLQIERKKQYFILDVHDFKKACYFSYHIPINCGILDGTTIEKPSPKQKSIRRNARRGKRYMI